MRHSELEKERYDKIRNKKERTQELKEQLLELKRELGNAQTEEAYFEMLDKIKQKEIEVLSIFEV